MKVLGEIEAEMRALGIWDAKEGTFEHWLQHHLSEPGLYDRAHEEWVKWGPEEDGPKALLVLLRRLDRLREFHPQVDRFGFYKTSESAEVGGGLQCVYGRTLEKQFRANEVCRIVWQIEMRHEKRERMLEMVLDWTTINATDRKRFGSGTLREILPGTWTEMAFAASWGWDQPGRWPIGRYETTVSYWGEPIATGEFEIV